MIGNERRKQGTAAVLLVLAWALWLHRWAPALLVIGFVVWVILHNRLEAGLGEAFLCRWRRAWPPGRVILIALLAASALGFVIADAPPKAKVMPVGLDVLALSVVLFGTWWRLVALPRWLGGAGPVPFVARPATATRTGA
jgi:hypothetical protein